MVFKFFNLWKILPVIISLPIIFVFIGIALSFFKTDFSNFSHIYEYLLFDALSNTIVLILGVVILTSMIGISLAWITVTYEFLGRKFFIWALVLPMAIPGYVMAFAMVGIFEYSGPFNSFLRNFFGSNISTFNIYSYPGLVITLSLSLYPYSYLLLRNAFQTQAIKSLEVGQSLGLSRHKSTLRISLPLAKPWILGGALLVVMETMADFGTVSVFNYNTLTTVIYKSWFDLYSLSTALQIASILLVFAVFIGLYDRKLRKNQLYSWGGTNPKSRKRILLKSYWFIVPTIFCGSIFLIGFVFPVIRLTTWALPNLSFETLNQFFYLSLSSIKLSILGTLVITIISLLLVFSSRLNKGYFSEFLSLFSTLGYALPGVVLAVSLYSLYTPFFSIFESTIIVMLLAYTVRFLAVAHTPIDRSLLRVTRSMDAVSNTMAVSGLSMFRKIHMPLIRAGTITAMVLVFVDIMKELPITLMTRPFEMNTLAVKVYEYSSEGLWEYAALPALAIVLVGFLPILILLLRTEK
jgi:iron(III) transport system permease protein